MGDTALAKWSDAKYYSCKIFKVISKGNLFLQYRVIQFLDTLSTYLHGVIHFP